MPETADNNHVRLDVNMTVNETAHMITKAIDLYAINCPHLFVPKIFEIMKYYRIEGFYANGVNQGYVQRQFHLR